MAITLFEFQQEAADRLTNSAINYFFVGQDRMGGRPIPFVGQLKAVTGAGKTPILANVIGRLGPSIVLWTTKFGSVVDQTVANLRTGGKYNHLLGNGAVEVINFSDIASTADWQRILERADGLTVLVSTVAAWNSAEKDDRLNVHRVNSDWGDRSRWEQLKIERKRKLWVVYDEAHNTTTDQVEQLDDLDPSGFFVASASPIKGRLQHYLTLLPDAQRAERIVPVSTRSVVEAQLLKSTISLTDYDASYEEMLQDVVERRKLLELELEVNGAQITPKAIYVVETSGVTARGVEPRPISIWRNLVDVNGVDPNTIAVCTNTKDLPKDAHRVERIEQLSEEYIHIIFNKKLQEGWDDPSVYVCYFDGKTDSGTRIQQVLGRAMRQPNAMHLSNEDLNTAYFYINTPNETLERITDQLIEELRIYKGADDEDDFEPFKIVEQRKTPSKISLRPELEGKLKVLQLQPELPRSGALEALIKNKTLDFSEADRAAQGKAVVNIVSVLTGDVAQNTRDLLEDMRVRCGTYLQDQIRGLSKNCANSIPTAILSNDRLDKTACYRSKALVMLQRSLPNETQVMQGLRNLEEDHGQATKDVERRGQGNDCAGGTTGRAQYG